MNQYRPQPRNRKYLLGLGALMAVWMLWWSRFWKGLHWEGALLISAIILALVFLGPKVGSWITLTLRRKNP